MNIHLRNTIKILAVCAFLYSVAADKFAAEAVVSRRRNRRQEVLKYLLVDKDGWVVASYKSNHYYIGFNKYGESIYYFERQNVPKNQRNPEYIDLIEDVANPDHKKKPYKIEDEPELKMLHDKYYLGLEDEDEDELDGKHKKDPYEPKNELDGKHKKDSYEPKNELDGKHKKDPFASEDGLDGNHKKDSYDSRNELDGKHKKDPFASEDGDELDRKSHKDGKSDITSKGANNNLNLDNKGVKNNEKSINNYHGHENEKDSSVNMNKKHDKNPSDKGNSLSIFDKKKDNTDVNRKNNNTAINNYIKGDEGRDNKSSHKDPYNNANCTPSSRSRYNSRDSCCDTPPSR
ncbi:hypothetical protein NEAUS04_2309 [Nematocida ausubeli]|nr:hypothetical protein NEAUS04_2309 [Nematocida ausubeli]